MEGLWGGKRHLGARRDAELLRLVAQLQAAEEGGRREAEEGQEEGEGGQQQEEAGRERGLGLW